jgi:hypothetical protein
MQIIFESKINKTHFISFQYHLFVLFKYILISLQLNIKSLHSRIVYDPNNWHRFFYLKHIIQIVLETQKHRFIFHLIIILSIVFFLGIITLLIIIHRETFLECYISMETESKTTSFSLAWRKYTPSWFLGLMENSYFKQYIYFSWDSIIWGEFSLKMKKKEISIIIWFF